MSSRGSIVDWAVEIVADLDFKVVHEWLAANPGRKACGCLPVYAPREVVHASGMLPVGIYGGGDRLEIIRGDAFYQSYICHLPRSVLELKQSGRLRMLSAMLFPSTCDVIRNLSGIWKMESPEVYVKYLDLPQLLDRELGGRFWEGEIRTLLAELGEVSGSPAGPREIESSIRLYNEVRSLVREAYRVRRESPWKIPTEELYTIMRAGEVVPPELFVSKLREYLGAVEQEPGRVKDQCRVIVVGSFCEQPPLGLIKTIERAGCAIVDDDFLLGNRMITSDVPFEGDPVTNLAQAFVDHVTETSVLFEARPEGKRTLMRKRVEAARADGIIFAAASFCDPALLDRQMLRAGADAAGIPSIAFQFAENTGQFQQYREQAGTFADSIKLWGGT
ncbi:MAG: benzoyl-CoA reductase subunit C [Thermoanaerobaculales bacterium]